MSFEIKQFVKAFDQAVQQGIAQRSFQLGKGQCKDMEEYKLKVGEIRGLEVSSTLAKEMLRQLQDAEDNAFDEKQAAAS